MAISLMIWISPAATCWNSSASVKISFILETLSSRMDWYLVDTGRMWLAVRSARTLASISIFLL